MKHFEHLSAEDKQTLFQAIPAITALIAGADGNMDTEEIKWAEKLTEIRGYAHAEKLRGFYDHIHDNFATDLDTLVKSLPADHATRNQILTDTLAKLNLVFPKLDHHTAATVYKSFQTYAEQIAKASGGFLRFLAVNADEAKWISLPMITPVLEKDAE